MFVPADPVISFESISQSACPIGQAIVFQQNGRGGFFFLKGKNFINLGKDTRLIGARKNPRPKSDWQETPRNPPSIC